MLRPDYNIYLGFAGNLGEPAILHWVSAFSRPARWSLFPVSEVTDAHPERCKSLGGPFLRFTSFELYGEE